MLDLHENQQKYIWSDLLTFKQFCCFLSTFVDFSAVLLIFKQKKGRLIHHAKTTVKTVWLKTNHFLIRVAKLNRLVEIYQLFCLTNLSFAYI
jgi:hypothetical protein